MNLSREWGYYFLGVYCSRLCFNSLIDPVSFVWKHTTHSSRGKVYCLYCHTDCRSCIPIHDREISCVRSAIWLWTSIVASDWNPKEDSRLQYTCSRKTSAEIRYEYAIPSQCKLYTLGMSQINGPLWYKSNKAVSTEDKSPLIYAKFTAALIASILKWGPMHSCC